MKPVLDVLPASGSTRSSSAGTRRHREDVLRAQVTRGLGYDDLQRTCGWIGFQAAGRGWPRSCCRARGIRASRSMPAKVNPVIRSRHPVLGAQVIGTTPRSPRRPAGHSTLNVFGPLLARTLFWSRSSCSLRRRAFELEVRPCNRGGPPTAKTASTNAELTLSRESPRTRHRLRQATIRHEAASSRKSRCAMSRSRRAST